MLTEKSDLQGIVYLITHIIGVAVTTYWIAMQGLGWPVAMVLQGIQLVFLFTLLHETVHDTPFANEQLNRIVGWICALIIFLPPFWFRYFHLAHHRHTHDPEHDPELQGKAVNSFAAYLWTLTGLPVWWFHCSTIFKNAIGSVDYAYLPKSARSKTVREARFMLGFYMIVFAIALVAGALDELIWLWLLPLLLGQPFLRLYLMAEHRDCPHSDNMFENTRTVFTSMPVRWLAWNMPYHAEHHAYPMVPFFRLPALHAVANEHLRITENGYARFHYKTVKALGRGN